MQPPWAIGASGIDACSGVIVTGSICGWATIDAPFLYLKDVLSRLPTQPNSRIGELLPHRWQPNLST